MPKKIYTIGHSTHSLLDFIALLKTYEINHLVDVRAIPKSRYVPWFNKERIQKSLKKEKIEYTHMPALGGRRHTTKDSINTGWRNNSFRGFADYMQTHAFFVALKELNALLKNNLQVTIMCAEALPWRCHRSLIADAEIARNVAVYDIISNTSLREHSLTEFAVINKSKKPIQVYYPKQKDMFDEL